MAKRGVKEAFSITYEIEDALLEELKQLGKTTKITIDEIENVLAKFGTPVEIATNYGGDTKLQENNMEQTTISTKKPTRGRNGIHIDPNARHLPRRKLDENLTIKEFIITNTEQGFFLLPLFLLFIAVLNTAPLLGRSYNDISPPVLSLIAFIAVELYSGITGRTGFRYSTTVKLRDAFRLMMLGMAITMNWSAIHVYRPWGSIEFQNLMEFWYINWILVEIIIFLRDHMIGLAPLKPEFPKFSKLKIIQWGVFAAIILFMFLDIENILKVLIGIPLILLNFGIHYFRDRRSVSFPFAFATFLTVFFTLLTIFAIYS
ncbi:MAG: hypothetical protein D6732_01385 [Methanobacteriota archaeon]|nr:MAG: hypothetical protein D6732_01385 [Euryarchaeota archaeon]